MKITHSIMIGDKSYVLEDEFASMKEAFEVIAPWQALEIEARNMKDVFLSHRKTADGDDYYALIRPFENLELNCGIVKEGNGKLFPGKYNKAARRTDKEWKRIQHATYGDVSGEVTGNATAALQPPPEQPSETKTPTLQEIAQDFARQGMVKAFGCANQRTWRVGPPGADNEVWKDEAGNRQCNCEALKKLRLKDAEAECQHIQAVVLFVNDQNAKRGGQHASRAQPGQ